MGLTHRPLNRRSLSPPADARWCPTPLLPLGTKGLAPRVIFWRSISSGSYLLGAGKSIEGRSESHLFGWFLGMRWLGVQLKTVFFRSDAFGGPWTVSEGKHNMTLVKLYLPVTMSQLWDDFQRPRVDHHCSHRWINRLINSIINRYNIMASQICPAWRARQI